MSKLEDFKKLVKEQIPSISEEDLNQWINKNQILLSQFDIESCYNSLKNYYEREILKPEGYEEAYVIPIGSFDFMKFDRMKHAVLGLMVCENQTIKLTKFQFFGSLPKQVRSMARIPYNKPCKFIYKLGKEYTFQDGTTGQDLELYNIRIIDDTKIINPLETKLPDLSVTPGYMDFNIGGKIIDIDYYAKEEENIFFPFIQDNELICKIRFNPVDHKGNVVINIIGTLHLRKLKLGFRLTYGKMYPSIIKFLENKPISEKMTQDQKNQIIREQKFQLSDLLTGKYIYFFGSGKVEANSNIESEIDMFFNVRDTVQLHFLNEPYIKDIEEENEVIEEEKPKVEIKKPTKKQTKLIPEKKEESKSDIIKVKGKIEDLDQNIINRLSSIIDVLVKSANIRDIKQIQAALLKSDKLDVNKKIVSYFVDLALTS